MEENRQKESLAFSQAVQMIPRQKRTDIECKQTKWLLGDIKPDSRSTLIIGTLTEEPRGRRS